MPARQPAPQQTGQQAPGSAWAFDGETEAAYQLSLAEDKRRTTRQGALLAAVLFAAFGLLDMLAISSALSQVIALRFGLVVPFLLFCAWWAGQPGFLRFYTPLVVAMFSLMGLSIELMVWLAGAEEMARLTYYSGLILVIIALYAWTFLDQRLTALIGFALVLIYLLISLLSHSPLDQPGLLLLVSNLFFMVAANIIGLYGLRARDRTLRENFLLQRSLQQERARAETLAQIKSSFLANMSHEIRTPLNGVIGLANIGLRDSSAEGKSRQSFSRILDSARLLLAIINDILDFSKIEAGKLHIELQPVHLAELVQGVMDLMAERAQERGLALEAELAADLPEYCLTDALRLQQVLINLLSNAIKFTEQGEVCLSATREGEMLCFAISDSGIGMTEEQQARLFAAFEQADGSITRKYGGTGLGLAICRRILDLMDGRVEVRSQLGQGSTFSVYLPCQPATAPQPIQASAAPEAEQEPQPLRGLRILVAEDNAVNQLIIEDLLCSLGAEIELVDNGALAVERVREQGAGAFDLVLMDIEMPVMDGYSASRLLQEIAPELPIIGQTAHAYGEEREKCFTVGMHGHVAKPLVEADLVQLIQSLR
ncbi:MAG: response regulator [Gammaproteobacteria bacterium]|nr:response regulator [Gammaproteobacteria bacterium]